MRYNTITVLENNHIQDNLYCMVIPYDGPVSAGQFVMVQKEYSAHLLGRAISVCDAQDGKMKLLYQAVGRGTKELSQVLPGQSVHIKGPVGHGFPIDEMEKEKPVALVGGGVGTAPLLLTARKLKEQGISCDAHLGFKNRSMLAEELGELCDNLYISTETGNEGVKGMVTGTLKPEEYQAIFCCGPTPMMEALVEQCKAVGTPIYVSLETSMACGMGACYVCTCTDKDGNNKRTCMDGPVFRGEEIDFHA